MALSPEERKIKKRDWNRKQRGSKPDGIHNKNFRPPGWRKRNWEKDKKRRKRRVYWLTKYKLAKGCFECGYNANSAALEFDHNDPSLKLFNISAGVSHSLKNLFLEIRKCQILCANCHNIKSYGVKNEDS